MQFEEIFSFRVIFLFLMRYTERPNGQSEKTQKKKTKKFAHL